MVSKALLELVPESTAEDLPRRANGNGSPPFRCGGESGVGAAPWISVARGELGAAGVRNAVLAGVDSIEHGFWIEDAVIATMVERGTWLVPTLSVTLGGFRFHRDLVPDYAVPKLEEARAAHLDSVGRAYRAGVRIAMGTDFPNIRKGETLAQELAYMVEAGMTPLDALIAGTAHGAELLGLADLGRIEPGARAALLVVDGDPTRDIARVAEMRHHRLVIHRGRALPRDTVSAVPA